MELGCPVFTVGALLSPSLPSCFPRVFLPLFSPFLPLLSAHARSTHWLTACCAPGLCRCSCYVPTVPFSPCPLRSSVTCCQSPPRPYSCGQQAKRFLDQNTKQALAEFHQSLATLPASHGLLRAGSSAELVAGAAAAQQRPCSDPHCSRPTARLLGSSAQRADPTQARLLGLHRKKSNRCEAREEAAGGGGLSPR